MTISINSVSITKNVTFPMIIGIMTPGIITLSITTRNYILILTTFFAHFEGNYAKSCGYYHYGDIVLPNFQ